MQFTSFKNQWLDSLLGELWQRWSLLGVAGYSGGTQSEVIEDPERLLIATFWFARWDGRLFDEVLSWTLANASSINVKRLASLLESFPDACIDLVSAVAAKVQYCDSRWKKLAKTSSHSEPLFYLDSVRVLPIGDELDPEFLDAGFTRGVFKDRELAGRFSEHQRAALVLKLRALLGMNAHADVLAYLSGGRSSHASGVARGLGYSQRAVQEILTQMEKGGGVTSTVEGRKKIFRLVPSCWSCLVPEGSAWNDEQHRLAFLGHVWEGIHLLDAEESSAMLLASKLRELTASLDTQFPQFKDSRLSSYKGESYLSEWVSWVDAIVKPPGLARST